MQKKMLQPERRARYLKIIAIFKLLKGVLLCSIGISLLFLNSKTRWLDAIGDWAGDELALHGYDLGGLEPLEVTPAQAATLATTNFGKRLVNLVKLRIVKEHGRELGWVIKRRLRRN